MKIFAGLHKKSTAGIACAFGIFFISSFAYSNTTETSVSQNNAASSAAIQAPATNTVEASNSVAQTPVTTNSSVAAPKPTLQPQTTSSASQLASLLGIKFQHEMW